jgi:hypothetical protein
MNYYIVNKKSILVGIFLIAIALFLLFNTNKSDYFYIIFWFFISGVFILFISFFPPIDFSKVVWIILGGMLTGWSVAHYVLGFGSNLLFFAIGIFLLLLGLRSSKKFFTKDLSSIKFALLALLIGAIHILSSIKTFMEGVPEDLKNGYIPVKTKKSLLLMPAATPFSIFMIIVGIAGIIMFVWGAKTLTAEIRKFHKSNIKSKNLSE